MFRRVIRNPTVVFALLLLASIGVWIFAFSQYKVGDASKALAVLGGLIGGSWTLYQFVLRKSFESALSIDFSTTATPRGDRSVVLFEVRLANIGNRRIAAPPALSNKQVVDYEGSIRYPCDLQVKKISAPTSEPGFVGWWSKNSTLGQIENFPEHISVLYEYTRSDKQVDFFMEPGEQYVLGHVFVLAPGDYMAKIVFVGDRSFASEYWSRIVYFPVPDLSSAVAYTGSS